MSQRSVSETTHYQTKVASPASIGRRTRPDQLSQARTAQSRRSARPAVRGAAPLLPHTGCVSDRPGPRGVAPAVQPEPDRGGRRMLAVGVVRHSAAPVAARTDGLARRCRRRDCQRLVVLRPPRARAGRRGGDVSDCAIRARNAGRRLIRCAFALEARSTNWYCRKRSSTASRTARALLLTQLTVDGDRYRRRKVRDGP